MKNIIYMFQLGAAAFCFAFLAGCSPASDQGDGYSNSAWRANQCRRRFDDDFTSKLRNLTDSFECGDGTPVKYGGAIAEEIIGIRDTGARTNCLERLRTTILAVEFSGSDYFKLSHGLASLASLQQLYLATAFRCGCDWKHELLFRLDFLKGLKKELDRPHGPDMSEAAQRPGLHITQEFYQKSLTETYDLHIQWMEEEFNRVPAGLMSTEDGCKIRRQIEAFLKRPIRTESEILRDRGCKDANK